MQQTRFACGTRRVTHIVEVTGIEGARIQMQEVFRFVQTGVEPGGRVVGHYSGCGQVPAFYDALQRIGVEVDRSMFAIASPIGAA